MPGEYRDCNCAQCRCDIEAVTDAERLMLAFLDCDTDDSKFGDVEARKLRAALRQDINALQTFFDLLVQDMLLGEHYDKE